MERYLNKHCPPALRETDVKPLFALLLNNYQNERFVSITHHELVDYLSLFLYKNNCTMQMHTSSSSAWTHKCAMHGL